MWRAIWGNTVWYLVAEISVTKNDFLIFKTEKIFIYLIYKFLMFCWISLLHMFSEICDMYLQNKIQFGGNADNLLRQCMIFLNNFMFKFYRGKLEFYKLGGKFLKASILFNGNILSLGSSIITICDTYTLTISMWVFEFLGWFQSKK